MRSIDMIAFSRYGKCGGGIQAQADFHDIYYRIAAAEAASVRNRQRDVS